MPSFRCKLEHRDRIEYTPTQRDIPSNVKQNIVWRDMKIYGDYAYVVADDWFNNHGMQSLSLLDLVKESQCYPGTGLTALKRVDPETSPHIYTWPTV